MPSATATSSPDAVCQGLLRKKYSTLQYTHVRMKRATVVWQILLLTSTVARIKIDLQALILP